VIEPEHCEEKSKVPKMWKKTGIHYRYGFQGQEADDELRGKGNSWNYKYRMHDARIGRFFAVDPWFQAKYDSISSFNYGLDGVAGGDTKPKLAGIFFFKFDINWI